MAKFLAAIVLLFLPALLFADDAPATQPVWQGELLAGRAALRAGHYDAATPLLQSAIRDAASDSLDAAQAINEMGKLDRLAGDYPQADLLDHNALSLRIKLLGENDPLVATTLENLGELDLTRGNYDAAEKELTQALSIRTKSFGEQNADTAESMSNLGYLNLCLCRFDQAAKLCGRAVEIQDAVLRPDDPARADAWDNLATLEQLRSNLVDAEKLFRRSLDLRIAVLGDDHPDVGASYDNLGGLYADWGDAVMARRYFKLAQFTRQNSLGENHPDTAESLAMLADEENSDTDLFPPDQTAAMLEKALPVEMSTLGQAHMTTQSVQVALAMADFHLNKLDDSERLLTTAVAAARQSFGENHFHTAYCEEALADLYAQTSAHSDEAEALYKQAIKTSENLFGPDDRVTGQMLESYAQLLKTQHRDTEAAPLEDRAKAIQDADELRNPLERLQGPGL